MMSTQDYSRKDTMELRLYAVANPLAEGSEKIDELFTALKMHASEFMPEQAHLGRSLRKFSVDAVKRYLSTESSKSASLGLYRKADPSMTSSFYFIGGNAPLGLRFHMTVPFPYFEDPVHAEERSRTYVSLISALVEVCHPIYGYAHSGADFFLGTDPHKKNPHAPKQVYEVHWLNIYGASMVEQIGRERVLTTPVPYIKEFPDGSVLFLSSLTPAGYAADEARVVQARALAHLRDDITEEEALARLHARSAILAPVERHWDPDIADLLDLTLQDIPYVDLQQWIAELNAYHPPEVSEWLTAQDALPSNVADVNATIDHYEGLYAEQLAAFLRKDVPEVMNASSASLPLIDYYFWHHDYPSDHKRTVIDEDLVPAIGAYLGLVMVRHLGGRWVPRGNLDESQVIVGDRAWLPFLRARHYMQSKQAVLDYSLTKFYRTAVLHLKSLQ
jgi:hypothetical protein